MGEPATELMIGIGLIIAVIIMRCDFLIFLTRSKKVRGAIVGYKTKRSKGGEIYAPIVTFLTVDNKEIRLQYETYSSIKPGEVGEEVAVFYDSKNPYYAMIDTRFNKYGVEVIFLLAGVWMIYLGLTQRS